MVLVLAAARFRLAIMADGDASLAALRALSGPKYIKRGLQELGVRGDSDNSVLHHWAWRLPRCMFDGHRSVMPGPDHLIFHGLTKYLIVGIFAELDEDQSILAGTSFRDALARSQLPNTRIYNPETKAVVSVGISEWASTLTVAAFVFRRVLPEAAPALGGACTPLQIGLEMLDAFTVLVNALYYFPRSDLDGETACRRRPSADRLRALGDVFFALVRKACLRSDSAALGRCVDKPNLHRLREVLDHVVPALQHVRHAQELLFENAHQPVKRAITSGNGWDDAGRAMERVRQCEFASRLKAQPSFFGVPPTWMEHKGVRAAVNKSMDLFSQPSGGWRSWGGSFPATLVPAAVRVLVADRYSWSFDVQWWARATKSGAGDQVQLGDAVSVLVLPTAGGVAVNVARGTGCSHTHAHVAFFSVAALLTTPQGTCSAVVHPFIPLSDTEDVSVDSTTVLYLPLDTYVRRALVLHSCKRMCGSLRSGVGHNDANRWRVFGRSNGYPARQG